MSRCLLHKLKLEEFIQWCNDNGFVAVKVDIDYQVAYVRPKNSKLRLGYGIWRRDNMPEHYTVDWRLEPIVRLYIKQKKATYVRSEEIDN